MGLEKVGVAYVSKTGKSLMLKIDKDPASTFTKYLCINRKALRKVMDDKKAEVDVMLVKA